MRDVDYSGGTVFCWGSECSVLELGFPSGSRLGSIDNRPLGNSQERQRQMVYENAFRHASSSMIGRHDRLGGLTPEKRDVQVSTATHEV